MKPLILLCKILCGIEYLLRIAIHGHRHAEQDQLHKVQKL